MTISAVVIDLIMPGLDGIELFEESRKIDRFDDNGELDPPKFILITALRPSASAPQKDMLRLQQAVDLRDTQAHR
jgi:CheY-like chemotaxis protein